MKTTLLILFLAITARAQTNTNLFVVLKNPAGEIVMTNAEFRSIVGRKLIFKEVESGKLKPFDVEAVSESALKQLGIRASAAIANQRDIDARKAAATEAYRNQAATAAQIMAEKNRLSRIAYEEKKKQDEIAAKIAEEERRLKRQEQLREQQQVADIEATRAEAARAKAAAGLLNRTP